MNVGSIFAGSLKQLCLDIIAEVCCCVVVNDSFLVVATQKISLGGANVNFTIFLQLPELCHPELQSLPRLLVVDSVADHSSAGSSDQSLCHNSLHDSEMKTNIYKMFELGTE